MYASYSRTQAEWDELETILYANTLDLLGSKIESSEGMVIYHTEALVDNRKFLVLAKRIFGEKGGQ